MKPICSNFQSYSNLEKNWANFRNFRGRPIFIKKSQKKNTHMNWTPRLLGLFATTKSWRNPFFHPQSWKTQHSKGMLVVSLTCHAGHATSATSLDFKPNSEGRIPFQGGRGIWCQGYIQQSFQKKNAEGQNELLGCGFKYFLFSLLIGEDSHCD